MFNLNYIILFYFFVKISDEIISERQNLIMFVAISVHF